jgi:hypothetical protein
MIHFISEDHEVIDEQKNMALQFPTKFHQEFTIATSPQRHDDCTKEEFLQGIDELLTKIWSSIFSLSWINKKN